MEEKIKQLESELNACKILLNNLDYIPMTLTDFWGRCSSFSIMLDIDNINWILPFLKKYGYQGFYAAISYIDGQLPIIEYQTEEFLKALEEIKQLNPEVIRYEE